jgi:CheY-like chemotaxis protein
VGQGSTFTFSLPLPERGTFFARLQQTEPPRLDDRESDPPCLLLVDPDPGLVSFVGRQFPNHRVVQLWPPDELDAAIRLHHPHAVLHNRRRWAGASEAEPAPLQTDLPVPIIVCHLPSQSWLEEQLSVAGCLTKPFRSNRLLHLIEPLEDVHDILVIDDERGFCHLVEQMLALSERTYRVRRAYNGRQGLEAMDEERPDLVLLDLVMPSVDGFTVLEEMQGREELRDVPVLLLTATSYLQDASRQQRGGIAVDRAGGLNAAETLKCIDALLGAVAPFYDESSTPATIAHTRDGA